MKLPSLGEIVLFLWDNCKYLHENSKEDFSETIRKHIDYGTIVVLTDKQGIVGVTTFNINNEEAYIINTAVRRDLRNKNVLKEMLKFGLKKFPKVTHLRFNSIDKKREFQVPSSLILVKEK